MLFRGGDREAARERGLQERERMRALLEKTAFAVERQDGISELSYRLAILAAQRNALLDARDDGVFDDEHLRVALLDVDVDELVLRLRGNQSSADRV
jgi:hypothetical protein